VTDLPPSDTQGPTFLNVLRFLDTPQAVALAAERTNACLHGESSPAWQFAESVVTTLGWDRQRLTIESCAASQPSQ